MNNFYIHQNVELIIKRFISVTTLLPLQQILTKLPPINPPNSQ